MATGQPKMGFRRAMSNGLLQPNPIIDPADIIKQTPQHLDQNETEDEIEERLSERFLVMNTMTKACALGEVPAFIMSGPPGVGKTYETSSVLSWTERKHKIKIDNISGFVRPTGLYKKLYTNRKHKQVLVFDDADSIFMDDVSLNLLKKACDSTETRHISWLAETKMETDEGEALPTHFEFEGSIIYITNLDFDRMVASGNKLSKHVQALESRAIYLDLTMKTRKDYMVRIKQVLKRGMAEKLGIS